VHNVITTNKEITMTAETNIVICRSSTLTGPSASRSWVVSVMVGHHLATFGVGGAAIQDECETLEDAHASAQWMIERYGLDKDTTVTVEQ
jgi:hypothetical protein